jgi:hypothetical protein
MRMNADKALKEVSTALLEGGFDDSDKRLTAFLAQYGIVTHNPDGSWKDTGDVLKEIVEVWERISDVN